MVTSACYPNETIFIAHYLIRSHRRWWPIFRNSPAKDRFLVSYGVRTGPVWGSCYCNLFPCPLFWCQAFSTLDASNAITTEPFGANATEGQLVWHSQDSLSSIPGHGLNRTFSCHGPYTLELHAKAMTWWLYL